MERYLGIGFIILCLSVLAGVICNYGYELHIGKEEADISPAKTNISASNNTIDE